MFKPRLLAKLFSTVAVKHTTKAKPMFSFWMKQSRLHRLTFISSRFMSANKEYNIDLEKATQERIEEDDITLKYDTDEQLIDGTF